MSKKTTETMITRAWQRQAAWLWLLLPVSWLYALVIHLRRYAYKVGLFRSYRAPVAVMVIGNITVGGSGKTPLIIALVTSLQQQGIAVGVISRGYGGDANKMPALVTGDSLPSDVGDEPSLIVNTTGVPMAVCPNRQQAITTLLAAQPHVQLIIADDGLQHYALQRDIEWIVVDVARGFGSGQLLPTGFLREPIARLKEATVIYHTKPPQAAAASYASSDSARLTLSLQPESVQPLWAESQIDKYLSQFYNTRYNPPRNAPYNTVPVHTVPVTGSKVHAVSGIGYPQRFFDTLRGLGFEVIAHPYPDHYNFTLNELLHYTEHPIIVTSKDAVKIRALFMRQDKPKPQDTEPPLIHDWHELASRLWVLPVTAELSAACYQTLQQQLVDLGIHYRHLESKC